MSTGPVKCSTCDRPLKQSGSRDVENGWRHADDSPRCAGATTEWAREMSERDYERECYPSRVTLEERRNKRNDPCRCGSGRKQKKCCGVQP